VFKVSISNMKKNISNERGQVVIIVALLLVSLLGMTALVVDVGSIYEERRQTQTVADAAALAGAQDLPEDPGQAIQTAIAYADLNGVAITEDNIQIYETYGVPNDTITVTPTDVNAPLFFARVLGVNSVTVNATATAVAGGPSSMDGLMPWSIPMDDYPDGLEFGESYDLKVGPHDHEAPGWFQLMAFDGPGADVYGDTIVNGCETEIFIEDPLYLTLKGNTAGPTEASINERLEGHEDCTFEEVVGIDDEGKYYVKKGACSRIVYIPAIEAKPEPPEKDVKVVKFLVFFLVDVEEIEHNVFNVTGIFIEKSIAVSSGEITGYTGGIKIIRLVK